MSEVSLPPRASRDPSIGRAKLGKIPRQGGGFLGISLLGCGEIGTTLAKAIDRGEAGNTRLRFVFDLDLQKSRALRKKLNTKPKIAKRIDEILADEGTEMVIEAASQAAVSKYGVRVLRSGKDLMIMSVGALVDEKLLHRLREAAAGSGRRIHIPSGSILGIDGIKSASLVGVKEVLLTTRKPPRALSYSQYLRDRGIDVEKLKEPMVVFEGSCREAVRAFPESVNIAATIGLAVGFDKTKVRVIADPKLNRNVHEVSMSGVVGEFKTVARNVPSPGNPRTSYMAALSAITMLKELTETVLVGT